MIRTICSRASSDFKKLIKREAHPIRGELRPNPNFATRPLRLLAARQANLLYGRDLSAALNDLDEAIRLDPLQAGFRHPCVHPELARTIRPGHGRSEPGAIGRAEFGARADQSRSRVCHQGDVARALRDYDAALILTPDDAGLYGFRAAARRQAGDEAGAKADDAKMAELMFRASQ